MADLRQRETHFEFGANWADFARCIDDARIANAEHCLRKLIGGDLAGKTFLDIGCGSGLSALAAIRLKASKLNAVDIDENSVATTEALLSLRADHSQWTVGRRSIFEMEPMTDGTYDIVYSWGVLHHTGAMWEAIGRAASLVAPDGRLVIAIYQRTPSCVFWTWEKRLYNQGPGWLAAWIRGAYKTAYVGALVVMGRNPVRYVAEYGKHRGMRWSNDVHDWLGGYPYESASSRQIDDFLTKFGFSCESHVPANTRLGLLGTGCSEYVYRRHRI